MSPIIEEFIFFHDYIIIILVYATTVVGGVMAAVAYFPWMNQRLIEGQKVERIWTTAPAVFLVLIAIPSLLLLYSLDETSSSVLRIKVVGHQ